MPDAEASGRDLPVAGATGPRKTVAERLKAQARALGFHSAGVVHPLESRHGDFYRAWIDAGHHGEMAYLARESAVRRREDLTGTMPEVRSVVVVTDEYFQEDAPGVPDDPSVGVIARYARGRDYHKVVKKKLERLLAWIREEVAPGAEGRAYVDTGPILERELAQRAGLGWFGKNTMLIDPRRGSYFFLGVLLLDVELEADEPFAEDRCGTCRRCLDACPTGALLGRDESGAPVMDATKCISYLTIEHRGAIPEELRPLMGNRVYGCDICQEVCPWNRFADPEGDPAYAARGPGAPPRGVEPLPGEVGIGHPGTDAPRLVELFAMTEPEWRAWSRGAPLRRAGYEGFRRNVAVAIGNWLAGLDEPPARALSLLRDAARDDPSEVVREHAAWALGQI